MKAPDIAYLRLSGIIISQVVIIQKVSCQNSSVLSDVLWDGLFCILYLIVHCSTSMMSLLGKRLSMLLLTFCFLFPALWT